MSLLCLLGVCTERGRRGNKGWAKSDALGFTRNSRNLREEGSIWLIAEDCHELLDALPVLVADPEKDGDIIKTDSLADDIADTARYGIKSMLALHPKPKEVERREMLEGFDDELALIRKMRDGNK